MTDQRQRAIAAAYNAVNDEGMAWMDDVKKIIDAYEAALWSDDMEAAPKGGILGASSAGVDIVKYQGPIQGVHELDEPDNPAGWWGDNAHPGCVWPDGTRTEARNQPTHWRPLPTPPSGEG